MQNRSQQLLRLNLLGVYVFVMALIVAPTAGALPAQDTPEPETPTVAPASSEAVQQLRNFRLPPGWSGELWGAEPMVANPVAFTIDRDGRIFVCESFRQEQGITDNRSHDENWIDHDLAAQTVADRIAYHKLLLPNQGLDYTRQDDRVRLLVDSDGNGQADIAKIFANRFNSIEDGSMAGVLADGNDVFVTCIPHLWRLNDADADGVADHRDSLHSGFGVRVAFRGHDLHGLLKGPDGRIYFSVGDRGYHVETPDGRVIADPESGAVFRCESDGSGLEVFATGLRNPQELAFDKFGNLFTGDNNSDSGDRARWVYVLEGGDSGWRMAYQYLPDRGPFNQEKIWHPFHAEQPAYIVPPVANLGDGPSGLIYYPGTGIGTGLKDCFLMCDFRGTPSSSGIRGFRSRPKGAFFELADMSEPVWQILATDLAIGPDGFLYVSDWVNGWVGENKGRIYRFGDKRIIESAAVDEVQELLVSGLEGKNLDSLIHFLAHPDQRIRMDAQFELVRREAHDSLINAARRDGNLLARLHALWGLDQLARISGNASMASVAIELLSDPNPEIRAQSARIVGDHRLENGVAPLADIVSHDVDPRVKMFAALAFSKLKHPVPSGLSFELTRNKDSDPALRHALIMGLANQDLDELIGFELEYGSTASVRGMVVALRRQKNPRVAEFLVRKDVLVAEEVARTIHDLPIDVAMLQLAKAVGDHPESKPFTRRALNACFRLGGDDHAASVARIAADERFDLQMRTEALQMLGRWDRPNPRDRVLGMWRPVEERSNEAARIAFSNVFVSLLATNLADLKRQAIRVAGELKIEQASKSLLEIAIDSTVDASTRATALESLASCGLAESAGVALTLARDESPEVRSAATKLLARMEPIQAFAFLAEATRSSDLRERQSAFAQLGELTIDPASHFIGQAMSDLLEGKVADDTRLDVIMAAEKQRSRLGLIDEQLVQYEARLPESELTRQYRDTLLGGDAKRGRIIFLEWTQVACLRCHRIGEDGGYVGPNLSDIGVKKDRRYLMESIVDPNRAIAENFDTVVILNDRGQTFSGIVNFENETSLRLVLPSGDMTTVDKQTIDERRTGKSSMPNDHAKHLTPADVRDLVEFLSQQKTSPVATPESLERTDNAKD
jgi:quinoprotein glucose dehydrogenase